MPFPWKLSLFPRGNLHRLFPSIPSTKDIRAHPLFRGGISRWAWRYYTHRLTRGGRWVLAILTILFLAIVPTLDIQVFVFLFYLIAVWVVSYGLMLANKPRVTLEVRHAQRVRAGETLPVEVTVTQLATVFGLGSFDLNLLPERLPAPVDAVPANGAPLSPSLLPGESRTLRLGLQCTRRGIHRLWGYRVESDFPFGLVNSYRTFPIPRDITVHPAFDPLYRLDLPARRRYQPGGVLLASTIGDSFEYIGNREYREGDNIRDIDWRTTARHAGSPIALREYREEFFLRVGLVLDTHVPRGMSVAANDERLAALERAISLCAAISDYIARQDYLVDIFAAGPDLHHLTAGRSLAYLDQILDILACVDSSPTEPLEIVAPQMHEYLARLTTVICIFVEWNETRRAFVDGLRVSGAGVKVLLVSDAKGSPSTTGGGAALPVDIVELSPADFLVGIHEL